MCQNGEPIDGRGTTRPPSVAARRSRGGLPTELPSAPRDGGEASSEIAVDRRIEAFDSPAEDWLVNYAGMTIDEFEQFDR